MKTTSETTETEVVAAPTISQVLGGILQNALAHPKTTIQSILTAAMFGTTALMTCGCISGKALAIAGVVLTVAKVGLGMIQRDGTQINVPGGTTATVDTRTTLTTPRNSQPS
jgi:hypothetical protein